MKIISVSSFFTRIPWGKVTVEFFSVLLAVFLAFLLNEWRQDHEQKKISNDAIQGIAQEIRQNLAFLQYNHPYHDTLWQFMEDQENQYNNGSLNEEELGLFKDGTPLNLIALNQYAWNAALETDAIRLMPFDLVQKLSRIYHSQESYNDLVKAFFGNVFTNMDYYTGKKTTILNMTQILFRNLVSVEKLLIQQYQTFLEEYPGIEG